MGVIDWIVIVLYFLVVLGIGFWSYHKVKDMSDYFMGGRRFGKIFMMFFAFGSGTSSEQAITVVAGTWRMGLVGIWWQFLWLWATPFYWIVAPVMRRMRALTTADYFEHRYNTSTATLYSVYAIMTSIVFMAAGLYGSGKMVNALTGEELNAVAKDLDVTVPHLKWNSEEKQIETSTRQLQGFEYAILAMTAMFVIYGMAGGLGAAIITDFIQGILTITFSFLLLPFVYHMIGGFGQLNANADLKDGMLKLIMDPGTAASLGKEPITIFYVFMLSLTALSGIVVQPHIMAVCGAGKTEMEGRVGFTFGNFLKRFCTIAWTFTGLACIVWYLGAGSPLKHDDVKSAEFKQLDETGQKKITEERKLYADLKMRTSKEFSKLPAEEQKRIDNVDKEFSDGLFGKAAKDILPTIAPGLIGLLLASLLAAVMSTSDAQMVVSSGLFTENLYKRFLVRNASQTHYLWVGRITGLLIVCLALALQTTFTDVIHALKVVIKTPAAIGISLWFGIVWRGWTPIAVWVSTLIAIATWGFLAYRPDVLIDWGLPGAMFNTNGNVLEVWILAAYMATGILSGFLVSLITPRTPTAKLDDFYRVLHTPIKPGEKPETPCSLPDDHLPQEEKLFNLEDVEILKPTWIGVIGFFGAWICVGLIIWLTRYLAEQG